MTCWICCTVIVVGIAFWDWTISCAWTPAFPPTWKCINYNCNEEQIINPSCSPETFLLLSPAIKLLYGIKNDFQIIAFWGVILSTLTERYQYFKGACCLFHPEDTNTRFLQTTGTSLPVYNVSHQQNSNFHIHCHKDLKYHTNFQFGLQKAIILKDKWCQQWNFIRFVKTAKREYTSFCQKFLRYSTCNLHHENF